MIGIKFFTPVISAYRTFSTTCSGQTTKFAKSVGVNRTRYKKNFPKRCEPKIEWTDEQQGILNHVHGGFSIFVTGSAGTGKTFLLEHIIKILKEVHGKSNVFVTASTGVAACALRGQTLHSFAGYGVSNTSRETLLARVKLNRRARRRWKKVEALVIDEISMVDAIMFENLEYIARKIRETDEIWGGIQLIVSGDFFQLAPILTQRNLLHKEFAFEADCWDASFSLQVALTKVFRQSDLRLVKLLQDIRKGQIDSKDLQLLEHSCYMNEPNSSVVRLYPRIEDVNKVNEERMKSLDEKIVTYEAADSDSGVDHRKLQLKHGMAPNQLALCKGARVMLIKNLNIRDKLCNGATGMVTGFVEPAKGVTKLSPDNVLPVVKFDSGLEMVIEPQTWEILEGESLVARRTQIPLILAWALSIHKCQGMTLDCIHTDLSRAFGFGMVYVALSRVRSLEGLYLSGFSSSKIRAHTKVLHFYKRFQEDEEMDAVPNQNEDSSYFSSSECENKSWRN